MKEKSEKRMLVATCVLLTLSLPVMFLTHREVSFQMDDLWYSTRLYDDTAISSFSDIVAAQIWHFNNWGGRSMAHGILQLTLWAGELAADIMNVAVTLLLAGVVCLVAGHRRLPAFFMAMAMLLGLNANWKMSMFWQSGAANYLYITVFVLMFAFCYLRELPEKDNMDGGSGSAKADWKKLPGVTLWILPLGVLAGWSNENMGPAMWIFSLVVILLAWKEKRKVHPWMILGNLACLFGSAMVIAAPGNFARYADTADEKGLLWRIYLRSYSEARAIVEFLFPALLLLILVLILAKSVQGVWIGRKNGLLLFTALLSWGAMFLSPHYPDRASFGTMALIICVVVSVTGEIVKKRGELAWTIWWMSVLIWLLGMYFCCEQLGMSWGWIL